MTVITISPNYDGYIEKDETNYLRNTNGQVVWIGQFYQEKQGIEKDYRAFFRFPLTSLPSNANVTKVRFLGYCNPAGGAAHLLDIHPYNGDGKADPQGDSDPTCWSRMIAGSPYIDDSIALRSTGSKAWVLGDGETAQACVHVENAKSAVNRFSLGFHEEGDNDPYAVVYSQEWAADPALRPKLEITYSLPPPPTVGYGYSDGLVCVQVAG